MRVPSARRGLTSRLCGSRLFGQSKLVKGAQDGGRPPPVLGGAQDRHAPVADRLHEDLLYGRRNEGRREDREDLVRHRPAAHPGCRPRKRADPHRSGHTAVDPSAEHSNAAIDRQVGDVDLAADRHGPLGPTPTADIVGVLTQPFVTVRVVGVVQIVSAGRAGAAGLVAIRGATVRVRAVRVGAVGVPLARFRAVCRLLAVGDAVRVVLGRDGAPFRRAPLGIIEPAEVGGGHVSRPWFLCVPITPTFWVPMTDPVIVPPYTTTPPSMVCEPM